MLEGCTGPVEYGLQLKHGCPASSRSHSGLLAISSPCSGPGSCFRRSQLSSLEQTQLESLLNRFAAAADSQGPLNCGTAANAAAYLLGPVRCCLARLAHKGCQPPLAIVRYPLVSACRCDRGVSRHHCSGVEVKTEDIRLGLIDFDEKPNSLISNRLAHIVFLDSDDLCCFRCGSAFGPK